MTQGGHARTKGKKNDLGKMKRNLLNVLGYPDPGPGKASSGGF